MFLADVYMCLDYSLDNKIVIDLLWNVCENCVKDIFSFCCFVLFHANHGINVVWLICS